MPPANRPSSGLVDTWGRSNNRLYADRPCLQCGAIFRPRKADSKYCSRRCAWANNGGQNAGAGNGWINKKGYHETRINGRTAKKHRLIAEQELGRPLLPSEDVHHCNENKLDNDPHNLLVLDHGEHSRLHNMRRAYKRGYKLNLTDEERKARSVRAKAYHASGKMMTPKARAALSEAEGRA